VLRIGIRVGLTRPHLGEGTQKMKFTLIVGRGDIQRVLGIGIVRVGLTRPHLGEDTEGGIHANCGEGFS